VYSSIIYEEVHDMKPKILSICGSPRKDGNTAVLPPCLLDVSNDLGLML